MIIQILNTINDDIKQIRTDVLYANYIVVRIWDQKSCLLRKMESVAMDLKHVLYQRKYRQNHSTNLLDMWLKVKNI